MKQYKPTWAERLYIRKFLQKFVLEAEAKVEPAKYKQVLARAEKDLLTRLQSQPQTDSMLETVWKQMLHRTVQARVIKPAGVGDLPDQVLNLASKPFSVADDEYLKSWRYRLWALPLALRLRRRFGTKYYRAYLYFDGQLAEQIVRKQHVYTYFDGAAWRCMRCGRYLTLVSEMVGGNGVDCGEPIPSWRKFLESQVEGLDFDEDDSGEDSGGQSGLGDSEVEPTDDVGVDVPEVHPQRTDDPPGVQPECCEQPSHPGSEDVGPGSGQPSNADSLGEKSARDGRGRRAVKPAVPRRRPRSLRSSK